MSEKICIFAGTTEGRKLAETLKDGAELTVCVATEYGEVMLEGIEGIAVHMGRLDEQEMEKLFRDGGFSRIIDATHPYADIVTQNIAAAAEKAEVPVIRILRGGEKHIDDAVYVSSAEEAAQYLAGHDGNVLLTTGAKEL
ncbi:MAG: precorrin-6A/cobalt-precorrin-6A reductase, partial [Oscillospiraceae bacterium]|nr:precorrin-6A/cobalt-precorrin-6A reductase [Oscillospiraceae bacterium]